MERLQVHGCIWSIVFIDVVKNDKETVYNSWFVNNDERLKAFRTIRRGVFNVIQDIKNGSFGNDFKGSSLEIVLNCITEQKQVFKGASHPFYWKPKLRIPDIYENEENKIAFNTAVTPLSAIADVSPLYQLRTLRCRLINNNTIILKIARPTIHCGYFMVIIMGTNSQRVNPFNQSR